MRMSHAIPALPVKDMERSVEFYRGKLSFMLVHREMPSGWMERV